MRDPTPATTTARANQRFPRRLIVALALLAAFVIVEIGVRLIQPDTLTYTTNVGVSQSTYRYAHGTVTDPHTVAQWYAIVNATPLPFNQDNVFISSTFVQCNGMVYDNSYQTPITLRFPGMVSRLSRW